MCGCKEEDFWKLVTFGQFLPPPLPGPRGARNLKFTIYVPFVPKMLHTKFEKNWTGGYQEVKNVQLLTDDARRRTKINWVNSGDLKSKFGASGIHAILVQYPHIYALF